MCIDWAPDWSHAIVYIDLLKKHWLQHNEKFLKLNPNQTELVWKSIRTTRLYRHPELNQNWSSSSNSDSVTSIYSEACFNMFPPVCYLSHIYCSTRKQLVIRRQRRVWPFWGRKDTKFIRPMITWMYWTYGCKKATERTRINYAETRNVWQRWLDIYIYSLRVLLWSVPLSNN